MPNLHDNATTMHGVFLEVFDLGVLLTGESGIGKSEIALGMISRGHRLIADDAVTFITNEDNKLEANCPEVLKDFIEVRGLGILNVKELYGEGAVTYSMNVDLFIQLTDFADKIFNESNRLLGIHGEKSVLGHDIPQVTLPIGPGRNISVLIEAAVRNHKSKLRGYNAGEDFLNRQKDMTSN